MNTFGGWLFHASERPYIKQYINANKHLIFVIMIFLSLIASGSLVPSSLVSYAFMAFGFDPINAYGLITSDRSLVMICVCMLSYFLPIFQFRFLMSASGRDLYLSLPIKRERLYHIHYFIGALFMGVATVWCGVVFLLFHPYNQRILVSVFVFLLFLLIGLCLYTFFTFIVVKSHSLLDAFIICMSYTLLSMMFTNAFQRFFQASAAHILIGNGFDTVPSHVQQFISLLSPPWIMFHWNVLFLEDVQSHLSLIWVIVHTILWMVFACFCFVYAKRSFVRKKMEQRKDSQEWVTYPLLVPMGEAVLILGYGEGQLCSFAIILLFVFSLIAHFFVKRKIHLDWRMPLRFIGFVLLGYGLMQASIATDFFGLIQEIPKQEDVEMVSVQVFDTQCVDCSILETLWIQDSKRISKVMSGQETMMKSKLKTMDEDVSLIVTFQYVYHDGEESIRSYYVTQQQTQVRTVLEEWKKLGILRDFKGVE
ncbi:MAG: hypothetical protein HFF02_01130 [Erysipelotrichaceae bacterium]|nr:hypothetical protein [Erysipelotrichaceae bacterium]